MATRECPTVCFHPVFRQPIHTQPLGPRSPLESDLPRGTSESLNVPSPRFPEKDLPNTRGVLVRLRLARS